MILKIIKVFEEGGPYYLEDLDPHAKRPEAQPYWLGSGAKRLGLLDRPFKHQDFLKALAGINPRTKEERRRRYRGTRMIQRDGEGKLLHATAAWDFTFSPFKDFSTLWAISPGMLQQVLVRLHHAAIQHTLQGLEPEVGFTRKGKGGRRWKGWLVSGLSSLISPVAPWTLNSITMSCSSIGGFSPMALGEQSMPRLGSARRGS